MTLSSVMPNNPCKASRSVSDKQFLAQAADRLEKAAQENRQELIEMLADYRSAQPTGNVDTSRGLVKEARQVLKE